MSKTNHAINYKRTQYAMCGKRLRSYADSRWPTTCEECIREQCKTLGLDVDERLGAVRTMLRLERENAELKEKAEQSLARLKTRI